MRDKNRKILTYQVFIEPKGSHLKERDKWKEQFLKEIQEKFAERLLTLNAGTKYRLTGVPFYNHEDENEFKTALLEALN